jgi:DNA-directed RNA polymerase specialized sigma24 family protein
MGHRHGPQYCKEWNADLIVIRARRFGLHGSDIDDVLQEVILDVIGFYFDPDRSNGASERTALIALIDNRLKELRRKRRRHDHHVQRAAAEFRHVHPAASDASRFIPVSLIQTDVRGAVARLGPLEREVCARLAQGHSVNRIASDLGCGWKRVVNAMHNIRHKFESWSLDEWLGER